MIYHGEATSIFLKENKVGPVELATTSFGQRFEISPLQLITAVSAICNDGILVEPKIVKKIENTDTIEELTEAIIKANKNLSASNESNDWEMIGKDIKKLQELIKKLETLVEEENAKKVNEQVNEIGTAEGNLINDIENGI